MLLPDFPLRLGRLAVPQRWLRIVNCQEAASAAADADGLVAEFILEHSDPERPTKVTAPPGCSLQLCFGRPREPYTSRHHLNRSCVNYR